MISNRDTIAALATPLGTSAIAIVRASGPDCAAIARDALELPHPPQPRAATHADYRNRSGALLDDVVAIYYAAPNSYTGDDILEISCHGNPFIAQKILEDLLARGCRPAEAGEFTRRAFANGRIDLSQAEAVMDLIHARSERALTAANQQLRGSLGRHLDALTENLLSALARIEAYIDFPDEDLPAEDRAIVRRDIEDLSKGTARLLATQHYGELLREGIRTVIIGEPNAGKSSLLNRLVGQERALVSAEPGTTRDFIEERLHIGPHCLRLIDTAGLNPSPAPLEKLGMQKTLERAAEADLFLLVLDATRPHPSLPPEILEKLSQENALIVLNKIDLVPVAGAATGNSKSKINLKFQNQDFKNYNITHFCGTSCVTGEGLDALEKAIIDRAETFRRDQGDEIIAINSRHADALSRAQASFASALVHLDTNGPVELLAADLRAALDAYGEIGGRIDNERMLDHLFATFCIGK
ncbi:tRNA modification GTPase [Ereboglobus sp. PH5-10]|uniref:tRNA uridine-5-carboxymethylaminomethyl(34) synthesis GTPase MnmE n=1 Tax=Ereboglobus sp. PH5-10 TaxID=2940629 RepID=UPI002404F5BE|nr:tRNA uridine-5-carboxymethylaminomethyl(34) synthesis GTPase MnmE [Ereboglobus sp. PH5-10]MDF9827304.1 tRNA modification GTPase [Ereboglobus sp. PH5-10]